KPKRALEERFRRYAALYYNGDYERLFGTRALRLLFLVGSDYGLRPDRQVQLCCRLAEQAGLTIARFATLDELLAMRRPCDLLSAPIWKQPGQSELVSLRPRP